MLNSLTETIIFNFFFFHSFGLGFGQGFSFFTAFFNTQLRAQCLGFSTEMIYLISFHVYIRINENKHTEIMRITENTRITANI